MSLARWIVEMMTDSLTAAVVERDAQPLSLLLVVGSIFPWLMNDVNKIEAWIFFCTVNYKVECKNA